LAKKIQNLRHLVYRYNLRHRLLPTQVGSGCFPNGGVIPICLIFFHLKFNLVAIPDRI